MRQVLDLWLDGWSSDEIGACLGITGDRVRKFAAAFGLTLSRKATHPRAVVIDRPQESALKHTPGRFNRSLAAAVSSRKKCAEPSSGKRRDRVRHAPHQATHIR
jgi:hypothetical protein